VRARAASLDPRCRSTSCARCARSWTTAWRSGPAAKLLLLFGGMALVLSGLGVYGVIAQDAQSREPEIGVQLALGAGVSDVRVSSSAERSGSRGSPC
jgi:hypothetical protein